MNNNDREKISSISHSCFLLKLLDTGREYRQQDGICSASLQSTGVESLAAETFLALLKFTRSYVTESSRLPPCSLPRLPAVPCPGDDTTGKDRAFICLGEIPTFPEGLEQIFFCVSGCRNTRLF